MEGKFSEKGIVVKLKIVDQSLEIPWGDWSPRSSLDGMVVVNWILKI